MLRLAEVAAAEGFNLTAYEAQANDLGELKLPGLLFWDRHHFVTLTKFRRGHSVTVHDPAVGKRVMDWDEFKAHYSGAAAELSPTATMKPETQVNKLPLRRLLSRVVGYGPVLLKMALVSLLLEILLLISPLFLQTVMDEVMPVRDNRLLWTLVIGFCAIATFRAIVGMVQSWLSMAMSGMVTAVLKHDTFAHLIKLPLEWFERRGVGQVTSRFTSLNQIRRLFTENILTSLVDGLIAVVMLVVLFAYEWHLALLSVISCALLSVIALVMYKRFHLASTEALRTDSLENNTLVESVTAISSVKMFGNEPHLLSEFRSKMIASTNGALGIARLKAWQTMLSELVTSTGDILLIAMAASLVIKGILSIGAMVGFFAYKQILASKLAALTQAYFDIKLMSVHVDNISDILMDECEAPKMQIPPVAARPKLVFESVDFRYEGALHPTLKNFDLTVGPGEIVGVTGASGCGKSTLIKILTGALTAQAGSIRLDTLELTKVSPQSFREFFGIVLQSDHLLTGTLLENVTMFDPRPDLPRVEQALQDAAIFEFVESCPSGLDMFIQGHAPTLSGGQKQRLMLARAFYKNAPVLVMDEATSHLDVDTEIAVCEAIRRKGLTTLIVAHRQETLSRCDRVLELG